MTGILPLDLTFAPDGALWVADTTGRRATGSPALLPR